MGTLTALALDVAAPRVEYTVKTEVSMPASFIKFFSQCPMVANFTGLKGFLMEINGGLCE